MMKRWSQLAPDECKERLNGWEVKVLPEIPIFISVHEARLTLAEITTIEASHRYLLQSAVQTAIGDRRGMFHLRGLRHWCFAEVEMDGKTSGILKSPYPMTALLEGYLACI